MVCISAEVTLVIEIKVQPKSSRNEIVAKHGKITVRVTSPPEAGKANATVLALLAKWLKVAVSDLSFVLGKTSRTKLVAMPDELEPLFRSKLAELELGRSQTSGG